MARSLEAGIKTIKGLESAISRQSETPNKILRQVLNAESQFKKYNGWGEKYFNSLDRNWKIKFENLWYSCRQEAENNGTVQECVEASLIEPPAVVEELRGRLREILPEMLRGKRVEFSMQKEIEAAINKLMQ